MPHIMSEFSLNILISFTELEVLPCRIFRPRAFDKGPVEGIGVGVNGLIGPGACLHGSHVSRRPSEGATCYLAINTRHIKRQSGT